MVKYLSVSIYDSSFALDTFKWKWQGQSVTGTPLVLETDQGRENHSKLEQNFK
jgi:hypothetical protein